jgi:hypothetical protein
MPEAGPPVPVGTVHVFDPNPLNWLFITWNTMEEPVRTDHEGHTVLALAEAAEWRADGSFAVTVRRGARFKDGKWAAPHPPGTYLNFHPDTTCTVEDERTCVFRFPEPDGLIMAKFRGFHIAGSSFWHTHGFGYKQTGSGEGHW